MDDLDLPPIERLQAVTIEPGDIIIATVPVDTDDQELEQISARLGQLFLGHKVVVITDGISLEVQRPEEGNGDGRG